MVGDDLLTRKASSINMRCVSASRRVRIMRHRDRPGGQKGLTSPAVGWGVGCCYGYAG